MRGLHIEIEYGTGARGYILKRCQEPHFNYCIQYSLQICRAYRYGGAPYSKVVRFTERPPHIHIRAPFPLQYGASILNMEVQPNDPQDAGRPCRCSLSYDLHMAGRTASSLTRSSGLTDCIQGGNMSGPPALPASVSC